MSVDEERRISSNKVVFRCRKTSFFEGRRLSSKKDVFSVFARTEYPAMDEHPLLLKSHCSATVSRNIWEFAEGCLERIDRLLRSG